MLLLSRPKELRSAWLQSSVFPCVSRPGFRRWKLWQILCISGVKSLKIPFFLAAGKSLDFFTCSSALRAAEGALGPPLVGFALTLINYSALILIIIIEIP